MLNKKLSLKDKIKKNSLGQGKELKVEAKSNKANKKK